MGGAAASPGVLLRARLLDLHNRLLRGERSWLKIGTVSLFGIAFWVGLFALFHSGIVFILKTPDMAREFLEYLLAIFFFFLGLMLAFSNAIIAWTSLFKSAETAFLMTAPVRLEHLYLYKATETLWFSSWAFLFLGTPMMAAFGLALGVDAWFYAGSAGLIAIFIFIPSAIGNIAALLIARFVPRFRRRILIVSGALVLAAAIFLVYQVLALRTGSVPMRQGWMRALLNNLAFAQSPLCPSYWVAGGISSLASASRPDIFAFGVSPRALAASARLDAFLYALTLFANALLLTRIGYVMSGRWFFECWCTAQASERRKFYRERRWLESAWDTVLGFVPENLRLLMLKDLRSFVRDPAQWSQFLIFFGLLGVYFFNLRSFAYHLKFAEWKLIIALLNLCATSLTLSTFTTRFVYPQLSLEGRRFWLLGVAPAERGSVIIGKFLFCFLGSVAVSESLILTSSVMLRVPPATVALHGVATLAVCFGLSGLAVGMGAVYPNFREDNPSKIVSGFGGTLNLLLSLSFVATMVAATGWFGRETLYASFGGWWRSPALWKALAAVTGIALPWGWLPLAAGLRSIRRLEF